MDKPAINAPAAALLLEIIDGPVNPEWTWVVSVEPSSGVLGTLAKFSAEQASAATRGRKSAAAHASHLRFALELATRRVKGENPDADWDASWQPAVVDAEKWRQLQQQIRDASAALRRAIEDGQSWDALTFQGIVATVAHTAYHLGALRQLLPTDGRGA